MKKPAKPKAIRWCVCNRHGLRVSRDFEAEADAEQWRTGLLHNPERYKVAFVNVPAKRKAVKKS